MVQTQGGQDAVPTRSASAWAQHQILDLVGSGELSAGQKLPPERELSTQLGVSRGSAREAISALVTMGILEARHGAGVYVTSLDPVSLLLNVAPVLGIIGERHAEGLERLHAEVEAAAAARAAARADSLEVLGPLHQALDGLQLAELEPESRHSGDRFASTMWQLSDERFHRAVAHLADDIVAEAMIALLRTTRERLGDGQFSHDIAAHRDLVSTITDRDPTLAAGVARRLVLEEFGVASPGGTIAVPQGALAHVQDAQQKERSATTARSRAEAAVAASRGADGTPAWFTDAKFGVIVHWGPYAIPGWAPNDGPRGNVSRDEKYSRRQHPFAEWYQNSASLPGSRTAEYHQRVHGGIDYHDFRGPFADVIQSWDPTAWTSQFAKAGARYVVQVAKHHDGYLMWPSRVRHPLRTDWRSTRDTVGELAAASRAAGMRTGIFYSSGVDWSFRAAPPSELADVETSSPTGVDYARYVEAQWRELISTYRPDGVWNDTGYPAASDAHRIIDEYHAAVSDGFVSDRFRVSALGGADVASGPHGYKPARESIRPLGRSFGWNRQESAADVLSGSELVILLLEVVTSERNLLLGVSPDDRGKVPATQAASLAELGAWLDHSRSAIYGTTAWQTPRLATSDGRSVYLTWSNDALHVIVEGGLGGDVEILGLTLGHRAEARLTSSGAVVPLRTTERGTTFSAAGIATGGQLATAVTVVHPFEN